MKYYPDINVPQGSIYKVDHNQSIATEGCTFCVGLVTIDVGHSKNCAHFDCEIKETGDMGIVKSKTKEILEKHFPKKEDVNIVAYCTSNKGKTTLAIIEGIKEVYENIAIQHCETDGINAHENGQIVNCITANDAIETQPSSDNGLATIKN
jgi:hypothetical protein